MKRNVSVFNQDSHGLSYTDDSYDRFYEEATRASHRFVPITARPLQRSSAIGLLLLIMSLVTPFVLFFMLGIIAIPIQLTIIGCAIVMILWNKKYGRKNGTTIAALVVASISVIGLAATIMFNLTLAPDIRAYTQPASPMGFTPAGWGETQVYYAAIHTSSLDCTGQCGFTMKIMTTADYDSATSCGAWEIRYEITTNNSDDFLNTPVALEGLRLVPDNVISIDVGLEPNRKAVYSFTESPYLTCRS